MIYSAGASFRTLLSVLAGVLLLSALQVRAADPVRVIVGIDGEVDAASMQMPGGFLDYLRGELASSIEFVRMAGDRAVIIRVTADLGEDQQEQLCRQIEVVAGVQYAVPDRRMRPDYIPTDPRFSSQWHLMTEAEGEPAGTAATRAWDQEQGAAGIIIALLDTGIIPHEDISPARILPGYDFISDIESSGDGDGRDSDASDPGDFALAGDCGPGDPLTDVESSWHGLHMTGTMIATEGNDFGGVGINFTSRVLPVRVLGKCGGLLSDTVDAMRWAAGLPVSGVPANATPANVLNLSFGGGGSCSPFEQSAIDEIVASGTVIVTSAGNEARALSGPALCDNIIVAGAVGWDGSRASYTNIGLGVTVSVPGGDGFDGILSTYNTGATTPAADTFALLQGTSVAAAQLSAIVSLMLSINPDLSPEQVSELLASTARPFPDTSCNTSLCGGGLVDASAAVVAALDEEPAPPPVTPPSGGGGGGGGGGCTVTTQAGADGTMGLLLLFAIAGLVVRSKARA